LLRKRKFAEALDAVRERVTFEVSAEVVGRLDVVGASAVLLGESFFSDGNTSGAFGSGKEDLPMWIVEGATQALAQNIQHEGARRIRESISEFIAKEERLETPEGGVTIHKSDLFGLNHRVNNSVLGAGSRTVGVGASLTTSRLVSYGALSEAESKGVSQYQVSEILDKETCEVCSLMHGRVFDVSTAKAGVLAELSVSDPESLKATSPFTSSSRAGISELEGLDVPSLESLGWNRPPFHPGCRGVIVPPGTVEDSGGGALPTIGGLLGLGTSVGDE
jgi:hypothetical protein